MVIAICSTSYNNFRLRSAQPRRTQDASDDQGLFSATEMLLTAHGQWTLTPFLLLLQSVVAVLPTVCVCMCVYVCVCVHVCMCACVHCHLLSVPASFRFLLHHHHHTNRYANLSSSSFLLPFTTCTYVPSRSVLDSSFATAIRIGIRTIALTHFLSPAIRIHRNANEASIDDSLKAYMARDNLV